MNLYIAHRLINIFKIYYIYLRIYLRQNIILLLFYLK